MVAMVIWLFSLLILISAVFSVRPLCPQGQHCLFFIFNLQEKTLESLQASEIYWLFCVFGLTNPMEVKVKLEPFGKQLSLRKGFSKYLLSGTIKYRLNENHLPLAVVILYLGSENSYQES